MSEKKDSPDKPNPESEKGSFEFSVEDLDDVSTYKILGLDDRWIVAMGPGVNSDQVFSHDKGFGSGCGTDGCGSGSGCGGSVGDGSMGSGGSGSMGSAKF